MQTANMGLDRESFQHLTDSQPLIGFLVHRMLLLLLFQQQQQQPDFLHYFPPGLATN